MSDSMARIVALDQEEQSRQRIIDKVDWMARQIEETVLRDHGVKIKVSWELVP